MPRRRHTRASEGESHPSRKGYRLQVAKTTWTYTELYVCMIAFDHAECPERMVPRPERCGDRLRGRGSLAPCSPGRAGGKVVGRAFARRLSRSRSTGRGLAGSGFARERCDDRLRGRGSLAPCSHGRAGGNVVGRAFARQLLRFRSTGSSTRPTPFIERVCSWKERRRTC